MTAVVKLDGVRKRFGARTVVDDVSVEVARGEVLALLGPSGSGKSTTLRLIAGLEAPDGGRILLGGEVVSGPGVMVAPERRRVGFVFQSFALFPHLTVEANVGFGTRDAARVAELLDLVRLAPRRRAAVHTLSGGEQQRVALARALAADPRVVLLDEPFANLDAALRRHVRDEVAHALRARAATAVLVTHDAAEAFALADHVAVMHDGRILQHGAPEDVYGRPASLEIAARTGEVVRVRGRTRAPDVVATALGDLRLAAPLPVERDVIVALRPESLIVDPTGVPARVVRRVFEGASTMVALTLGDEPLVLRAAGPLAADPGGALPVAVRGPVVAFEVPADVTAR